MKIGKQQGMSLVVVMSLSLAASLLVFTALQDTATQERMSGNFQKRLNAEQQADRAAYDSFHRLNDALWKNPTATDEELLAAASRDNTDADGGRRSLSASGGVSVLGMAVQSKGFRYADSQFTNNSVFRRQGVSASSLRSPFEHGVTGCDGVVLSASGIIDSYDSELSAYSSQSASADATVRTLRNTADIELSGDSPIHGDVLSTNRITISGSSVISGKVRSNSDISLTGGSEIRGDIESGGMFRQSSGKVMANVVADDGIDIRNGIVSGNLHTMGNYYSVGITVPGEVRANGNVELDQGRVDGGVRAIGNFKLRTWTNDVINNGVRAGGNITINEYVERPVTADDLRYGGVASVHNVMARYREAPYKVSPAPVITPVQPVTPVPIENTEVSADDPAYVSCDPLHISTELAGLEAQISDLPPFRLTSLPEIYDLSPTEGRFETRQSASINLVLQPQNLLFLNQPHAVFAVSSAAISGNLYIDGGDVTLFVDGDFVMDASSSLNIASGSSLTLIVTGKVTIGASARVVTPQYGLTAAGMPVFAIYSSYSGADGINLKGASDMYAAIYAPLTDIKVTGSGQLMGSVLGKTVVASGAGGIHYDLALGRANVGNGETVAGTSLRVSFVGWR